MRASCAIAPASAALITVLASACALGLPDAPEAPPSDALSSHRAAGASGDAGSSDKSRVTCTPQAFTDVRTVQWRPAAPRRHECGVSEAEEIGRCTANAYDLHGCDHMKTKYARCWACAVSALDAPVHSAIIEDTQLDGFWPNHAGCVATETQADACGRSIYVNDVCTVRMCDHCNNDDWESCIEAASVACDRQFPKTCAGVTLDRCFYSAANEAHYIGLVEYFCGG